MNLLRHVPYPLLVVPAAVLDSVRTNGLVSSLEDSSLHQVYQNTIVGGVLQEAARQQADMLVVVARHHSLLGGLFHRSVTAQVLRDSRVPVLLVPVEAPEMPA